MTRRLPPTFSVVQLSDRHRQVVELTCDGDLSAKEVAAVLGLKEATVAWYRSAVVGALNCRTMCGVCMQWGRWRERIESGAVADALRDVRGMRSNEV